MSKTCALFVLAATLTACLSSVATLEPRAQNVKLVHETDRPLRCEVLGKINGVSESSDEKEARTGAENDFRNSAAALKANFAFVETERSSQLGTGSQRRVFLEGKALGCQTEEMEAEEEKAQAAQREEKEKAEAEAQAKEEEEKQAKKAKK
jgi:Domain of unknown function (DUF4156)